MKTYSNKQTKTKRKQMQQTTSLRLTILKELFSVLTAHIENDKNGIFTTVLRLEISSIDLINRKNFDFYIHLKEYLNVHL